MSNSTARRIPDEEEPNQIIVRHRDNGALHTLLLKACPPDKAGEKSITILARKLGLAPATLHKWVRRMKIPPERVTQIVDIAGGRVTIADFNAFVYTF